MWRIRAKRAAEGRAPLARGAGAFDGASLGGLKLLTIAKGFDEDFDDLHPTRLRRFHIGPMYSMRFTMQTGPLREVLEAANSPVGEDWAMVWTEEELVSERVEHVKSGWFGSVERQIFALDPFSTGRGHGGDAHGAVVDYARAPLSGISRAEPAGVQGCAQVCGVGSGPRFELSVTIASCLRRRYLRSEEG